MSRERVSSEPFDVSEAVNDVPKRLLSQLFRLQSTPIALSPMSVIPGVPSKLDPWTILYNATYDLFAFRFRYFRADIRMIIKINSVPLDYGWIGISWYPSDTVTTTISAFSPYNADPWLFPISVGGTHEIIIPYCAVQDGYSTRQDEEAAQGYGAAKPMVYLTKYGGNTLANTFAASLTIEVGWHNIKCWGVAGYAPDASPGFVLEAEGQMMMNGSVPGMMMEGAKLINNVGKVASTVSETYKTIKGYHEWTKEAVENANSTYKEFKAEYEEANKLFENISKPMYDMISWKEESAVDGTTRNAPTPFGGMTNLGITPIENFAFSQVRVDREGLCDDATSHRLVDIAQIPCIHTTAELTQGQTMTLLCAPFPGLGYADGSNTAYGNQMFPDYFAQMTQFFRKWRGSIDYSFLIDTSSLANGQVSIRCDQLGSERVPGVVYNPLTDGRYLFKRTEQVTGFTRIDVTVPFVFSTRWCPVNAVWDIGGTPVSGYFQNIFPSRLILTVEDLTASAVGTGVAPKLEIIVLRSAGHDIQFCNFVGGEFERFGVALEAEGQMRVRDKPSTFTNILGGPDLLKKLRPVPEDRITIEQMCHRWSTRPNPTNLNITGCVPHYPVDMGGSYAAQNTLYRTPYLPDYFDYLTNMFRYVRGNIQMRIAVGSTSYVMGETLDFTMQGDYAVVYGDPTTVAARDAISSGTSWAIPAVNPVLEFEVPIEAYSTDWLVTAPQCDNSQFVPQPLRFYSATDVFADETSAVQVRAGNSFQLAFLAPPMENWWSLFPTNNLLP